MILGTKTALVTGGNRGIGFAIAQGLSWQGYHVLVGCRDISEGHKAANSLGGATDVVLLELSNPARLQSQIERLLLRHPVIDVLVNNAGVLSEGNALEVNYDIFATALQINALSPFILMQKIIPHMMRRKYGRIVNISSDMGRFSAGLSGPASYAISKTTLNAITLSFAGAVPSYIKINAACPGWVQSRMGGDKAPRTVEEGAKTPIWLATLPPNGPNGGLFQDEKALPW